MEQTYTGYVQVLPSDELYNFDLKGLSPEMFCVNISDMINIHKISTGIVENEKQIPVARWNMNYDEFLQAKTPQTLPLTHQQVATLLKKINGYVGETDNQYIDFEERVVNSSVDGLSLCSGYRLTIATEDIEGQISTDAFYSLDTCTEAGWSGAPPPTSDFEIIRAALENKLQAIRKTGVHIGLQIDETDYALT